jgi:predicted branched-subunit amino acid permease
LSGDIMQDNIFDSFQKGVRDGLPIALGYLSVSFAFGMTAVSQGIPLETAVLISLTNVTSAGQFAGLQLIVMNASYIEMAMTQLIINLRYALMSLALSQKLDHKMSTFDRCIIAFGNTDEIFAVASRHTQIGKHYMWGLMGLPIFCWTIGTFFGGFASSILPLGVRDALGIAIYGMFIAIILPPAKVMRSVRIVLMIAIVCSCIFASMEHIWAIGSGFSIIICTLLSAALGAWLFPIEEVKK